MVVSKESLWERQGRTGALRTQGLIVPLPGGGKLLKALVADLGLVKLLRVARELMKNDVAIALFGNALSRLLQGFGHCEECVVWARVLVYRCQCRCWCIAVRSASNGGFQIEMSVICYRPFFFFFGLPGRAYRDSAGPLMSRDCPCRPVAGEGLGLARTGKCCKPTAHQTATNRRAFPVPTV